MDKNSLEKILEDHKKWIQGMGGKQASLYNADLHGMDLEWNMLAQSNFIWSKSTRSRFTQSKLAGRRFTRSRSTRGRPARGRSVWSEPARGRHA